MKIKIPTFKKILIHLFIFVFIVLPVFVRAEQHGSAVPPQTGSAVPVTNSVSNIKIENPFRGGDDFISLLKAILNNIVMPIVAVAVVAYIIYAGFKYVTARGNPAEITKAHQQLLWALIGAGVLLGAAGISAVVQNTVRGLLR